MSSNIGEDSGSAVNLKAEGLGLGRAIARSKLPPNIFPEFKAPGKDEIFSS